MILVRPVHVIPNGAELRLHASAVRLGRIERFLPGLAIRHRFELAILRDAIEIADAGALHGERLASRLARSIVTEQAICALLQGVVSAVSLPLHDGGALTKLAGSGGKRALNRLFRGLGESARAYSDCDEENPFHGSLIADFRSDSGARFLRFRQA